MFLLVEAKDSNQTARVHKILVFAQFTRTNKISIYSV